jgi:hypothetical protein
MARTEGEAMTWYDAPTLERQSEGGVEVWKLRGDWTRDLPLDVRHRLRAELNIVLPERVVLDLGDIKFIDSWGEETICDLMQRARDEAIPVAWTRDASRPSEYEGLKHALQRRKIDIQSFENRPTAIATVKSST